MKNRRFVNGLLGSVFAVSLLCGIPNANAQKVYKLHLAGNNLWTATDAGLVHWNTASLAFDMYTTDNGISSNDITALTLNDGVLWLGTPGGGVCSGTPDEGWSCNMEIDGVVSNHIVCAVTDGDGLVWLGSKYDGVCSYNNDEWTIFTTAEGLINNDVRSIYSHADGSVWFATAGGISILQDDVWNNITSSDGLPSNDVRAVIESVDGGMWVACGESMGESGGVGYLAGDGTWTRYRTTDGLGDNDVHCLALDESGAVWCGTFGGVSRFKDGVWKSFNLSDSPLKDEWVYDITTDSNNKIWLGTSRGLYQFDGERNWAFFSAR